VLGNIESLGYFVPELLLVGAACVAILWELYAKGHARRLLGVAVVAVAALAASAALSTYYLVQGFEPQGGLAAQNLFNGLLAFDRFANLFRLLFAIVTAVTILFALPAGLSRKPGGARRNAAEMIILLLVVTLGLNMMAASRNLLMVYLSLEMVSVLSFVLAGFKIHDRKSSEGALKYVIYGGVASGVMLYGMSWIYGLTGSLSLPEIWQSVAVQSAAQGRLPEAVIVGVICMLVGFGYKVSAVPFHMWTPDVYEGAPTPITAFLSVGPKAAGFALLVRFFADGLGAQGEVTMLGGGAAVGAPWAVIAGCLAMATMTVGNLTALNQENVKRMLAFSSVAHAGYMLMGFAVFSELGVTAVAFYLFVYCLMNLGAFLIVLAVAERNGGDESIDAYRGLGKRAPLTAVLMSVFLFSLAGIPPLAGFAGKLYLFMALIKAGGSWNWLMAVVGILNSVIALFYYVRVMRAMYLEEGEQTEPLGIRRLFGATGVVLAVPVLVFGVYWSPLYDFVASSLAMVR